VYRSSASSHLRPYGCGTPGCPGPAGHRCSVAYGLPAWEASHAAPAPPGNRGALQQFRDQTATFSKLARRQEEPQQPLKRRRLAAPNDPSNITACSARGSGSRSCRHRTPARSPRICRGYRASGIRPLAWQAATATETPGAYGLQPDVTPLRPSLQPGTTMAGRRRRGTPPSPRDGRTPGRRVHVKGTDRLFRIRPASRYARMPTPIANR
jgi:hypothetical protein